MAGGAFNLGDVLVTFVANVEGMLAGLKEVQTAAASVAATASKDLEEVGVAGKEAGVGIAEGGAAAEEAAGGFSLLGGSMLETLAPLIAVLGAYEGLKAIVEGANTATNEWNNAQVQVKNTLQQTSDAVGLTAEEIDKMAEAFSKGTPITRGAQLQGEATLLTYQAIGKDIFPQVAAILPDVATAFANVQGRSVATSEDVAQAAKKIGVALTDPEKGVNALTRAGIKFTAAQQDAIKVLAQSGDTLGAQKLLLSDFANMTAGKATASLNTYQGAIANAKKQLDDFTGNGIRFAQTSLEKLGDALLVFGSRVLPGIEALGKKIFEYLAPAFVGLWEAVKNLLPTLEQFWKEYLEPIAKIVGEALVVGLKYAVEALTVFINAVKDTIDWLDKHKKGVMEVIKVLEPIAGAILIVVAAFKIFAFGLATVGKAIEVFKGIWAGVTALMETNPIVLIITGIIAVTLLLLTHWKDVKKWFDDFMGWLDHAGEFIKKIWGDIEKAAVRAWQDIDTVIHKVLDWFADRIQDVTGFLEKHKKGLTDIGIVIGTILLPLIIKFTAQLVIAAAQSLAAFVVSAAKTVASFVTTSAGATVSAAKTSAAWVVSAAKSSFAWVTQELPKIIAGMAKAAVQGTINAVKVGAAWILQAVRTTASWALTFARFAAGIVIMVAQFLIQMGRMAAGWLLALGPLGAVLAIVVGVVALIIANWNTVKQWFDDFMKWLKQHWEIFLLIFFPLGYLVLEIIKHWSDLKHWFMDFIHDVGGFFHQLWMDINGVWQGMVNDAENIFDAVVKWFKDLPGKIIKAIGDVSKLLFNIGKDIIQGLINGLENMVGAVKKKIGDVANDIKNVAKKILGIFSPSTVFHEIGRNIGQGMANGIDSMQDVVSNAAAGMASATLVGANGSLSGASFGGGGYGSGFTVSLDGAQIIGTVPKDVAEKIGDAIIGKLKQTVRI